MNTSFGRVLLGLLVVFGAAVPVGMFAPGYATLASAPMDEVQRLLDQLVAAGAPGAAGWVEDERDSLRLLPGGGPGIPPPRSSGYSLPLGPPGQVADGTRDGRRQLGVMVNVLPAPDPVYEAFIKGLQALGVRLLSGERP